MHVINQLEASYGDISAFNPNGPDQGRLSLEGKAYASSNFPKMDFIKWCTFEELSSPATDYKSGSNSQPPASTDENTGRRDHRPVEL